MKWVHPLILPLLVAPACGEVTIFLAMEPPQRQRTHSMQGDQPLMRTAAEIAAMNDVGDYCMTDVMHRCSDEGSNPVFLSENPFVTWLMAPVDQPAPFNLGGPPPSLLREGPDDIGAMLNHMMDVVLEQAPPREAETAVHLEQPKLMHVEHALDTMVASLAQRLSSESASEDEAAEPPEEAVQAEAAPHFDPVAFAKRVADHGKQVLESDAPEERRHLARRLTAVEPDMFTLPRLPFGCRKNHCLWKLFDNGQVSPRCSASLRVVKDLSHVQQVRHNAVLREVQVIEKQQDAFLLMVLLYGVLALGTLVLLVRRFRKHVRSDKMRLKRRILQAIYSNPEIKAKVEDELQEDLGSVPPLSPYALASMSAEGRERLRSFRRCRVVKIAFFSFLMWLAIVQPFVTMFILCVTMGVRFCNLMCCAKEPMEDCTCCCCGGSTKDVRLGTVSSAQECCTCCRGTGVCPPSCNDCCHGDSCGCDCADGCNCCDPGCTCCCCGVSERDVRMGKVTAKQECCSCCRGTGVCGPGCSACCNGGSCCCDCTDGCDCCTADAVAPYPATRRRHAASHAYEGVPVQVV